MKISASRPLVKSLVFFFFKIASNGDRNPAVGRRDMPWDPLGAWPNERRWIWLTAAFWVLRGPAFVENLYAAGDFIPDFFQDYASARNWFERQPIYADHHDTLPRYLHVSLDDRRSHVFLNAHAPTSVLLALPFAKLDFSNAFHAWNIASLAALAASILILQQQLRIPISPWSIAPLLSLLMLCHPLWEQTRLGQLTLVLLLLVTGSCATERSGRPRLAEDSRHPGIRRVPLGTKTPAFHWLAEGWVNYGAQSLSNVVWLADRQVRLGLPARTDGRKEGVWQP